MELTPLRYFVAIAAERHMTRAAQRLGVTQPALSAALKRLEAEVGAELFHRTAKGVELTGAGRVFLEHADDVIRRAEESVRAVRQLAGLERGSIAVGGGATATGYLLPAVVGQFRKQHAGIRFSVREAASRTVAEAVLGGSLDLGIVTVPAEVPGGADLMEVASLEDELLLIVPPGHRLSGRKSFRWRDLEDEHFIGFEAGTAVRSVIDDAATEAGVALDVVMELRSIEAIKQMVRARIGEGAPVNTIFRGRRPTGEIYRQGMREEFPDRDWILTRILWLSGSEKGFNRLGDVDTMRRYIYIHGAPDEVEMGEPGSIGCIRMHNQDLIKLFNMTPVGTPVTIHA